MSEPPDTQDDPPFTETEVLFAIQSMANKKAPGHDRLTAEIIKKASSVLLSEFTSLFNQCLKHHTFPISFKESIVKFIPKPNANNTNTAKAFRPICLLRILYSQFLHL